MLNLNCLVNKICYFPPAGFTEVLHTKQRNADKVQNVLPAWAYMAIVLKM